MLKNNESAEDRTTLITFTYPGATKNAILNIKQSKEIKGSDKGAASLEEDWTTGAANNTAGINGWITAIVNPANDDWEWQTKAFGGNQYAQASAQGATTGTEYDFWLISPALDLNAASPKTMSFTSAAAYFQSSTLLEVYLMDAADPAAGKVKLEATLAVEGDLEEGETYTPHMPSGEIDLSAYTGIKHIGYRYVGMGGSGTSTTYQVDNFKFGVDPNAPQFNVPTLNYTVGSAAGDVKINVTGNVAWTAAVTEGASYVTNITSNGTGEGAVNVSLSENTSQSENRIVKVKIATTENAATKEYFATITQSYSSPGGSIVISLASLDPNGELPVNGYGTQTDATPYTWTQDGVSFAAVKVCQPSSKDGSIQHQGNTDTTKQGKVYNTSAISGLKKVIYLVDHTASKTGFAFYASNSAGDLAGTPITPTVADVDGHKQYTFDLSSGNYTHFISHNNNGGALYIWSVTIEK
jgi:hypothetical protein